MASSKWPAVVEADLPRGYVLTSSGRVSGVHEAGDVFREAPFSDEERLLMDNVLLEATRLDTIRREPTIVREVVADSTTAPPRVADQVELDVLREQRPHAVPVACLEQGGIALDER